MAFGAFIIGDEILVGKRQDKHLAFVIGALARRGLRLAWAQYLGDDPERVALRLHPDAEREIRARFGGDATPQRLKMGEFPEGSRIIPNPVNRIPGFSLHEHHFVPGFPQMAAPMVEWVLDTQYKQLFDRDRWAERSILVYEAGESQLIPAMEAVGARFPDVKVFSLPSMGEDGSRIHVELGVRGNPARVGDAIEALRHAVSEGGFSYK